MCFPTQQPMEVPPKAAEVPLGTGLADRAKLSIMSRKGRIDAAVHSKQ